MRLYFYNSIITLSVLYGNPNKHKQAYYSGGPCEDVTPDPIPNSEVKLLSADDTPSGESRSPPE